MTLTTATSAHESRFDPFLYAAVREDPDGAPLTVLSVFARLDIDPWEEAARLAQLPGEAAALVALTGLISALPTGSVTPPDSGTIAARLITLLPRHSEGGIAPQGVSSGGLRVNRNRNWATILAQQLGIAGNGSSALSRQRRCQYRLRRTIADLAGTLRREHHHPRRVAQGTLAITPIDAP